MTLNCYKFNFFRILRYFAILGGLYNKAVAGLPVPLRYKGVLVFSERDDI